MSYSRDFLICIKFCETVVIVLDFQPALRGWFLYEVSRSAMFTSLPKLVFHSFYNLDFNSLIRLGNWFNCLLLLMQIRSKI